MIDPTELTDEQMKAFKSLQRAIKKCEAANIYWYQVLDNLKVLNGDVVEDVEGHDCGRLPEGTFDLTPANPWSILLTCSWADDAHHVILK